MGAIFKGQGTSEVRRAHTFLRGRAQALEATAPNEIGATKTQVNGNQRHLHTHLSTSEQQGEYYEETHKNFKSGEFKKLSIWKVQS